MKKSALKLPWDGGRFVLSIIALFAAARLAAIFEGDLFFRVATSSKPDELFNDQIFVEKRLDSYTGRKNLVQKFR